ncbi:hypothetical protein PIB30_076985 [Stylosanthes scabra]|uniref:Uncharacterized protein n=1 Tax=Stylosanthes scabra TaxID=79078 RepID=A0ABU6ZPA3_9FABA|nr:hypothetical protein [Stylosanthes scabra]
MKADAELETFKIRRYHFDDESFVHSLHSVRLDPDCPYEILIKALMADQPLSSSGDRKSSTRRNVRLSVNMCFWMLDGVFMGLVYPSHGCCGIRPQSTLVFVAKRPVVISVKRKIQRNCKIIAQRYNTSLDLSRPVNLRRKAKNALETFYDTF